MFKIKAISKQNLDSDASIVSSKKEKEVSAKVKTWAR